MFEEENTLSLIEENEKAAYEELKKLDYDDPKRSKVLSEARSLTETRLSLEKADQERSNSYSRNEIEEEKLRIEAEKVKTDRKRITADLVKIGMAFGLGVGAEMFSYTADVWLPKNQSFKRFSEKMRDWILRK